MEISFGHLHLYPKDFWGLSFIEWEAALEGYRQKMGADVSTPLSRDELTEMMEKYPDDRKAS